MLDCPAQLALSAHEHDYIVLTHDVVGLRILDLDPDGPAARAGLRGPAIRRRKSGFVVFEMEDRSVADLIVGVNGKKTLKVDEFLSEVESYRPGDRISVIVVRDGKPLSVDVTLGD